MNTVRGRTWAIRVAVVALVGALLVVPYVPVGAWPLPDTGSMEPSMRGCDVLVYGPAWEVETGDVVIADAPWRDGVVIHRVVDQTPDGYVLKGDANGSPDVMAVPPDHILAEVQYVVKVGSLVEPYCAFASETAMTTYETSREGVAS